MSGDYGRVLVNTSGNTIDPINQGDTTQTRSQDGSPDAGSGSAVSLNLGDLRQNVDAFYDVGTTDDDIIVEVSHNGDFSGEEKEHTRISQSAGDVVTGGKLVQVETVYQHIRIYAGSGFTNADVNELEIVSRGI